MAYKVQVSGNDKVEVQLQWRRLYTTSQIMEKMQRWLIDLDSTGKALIVIADSTAANGVGWAKKSILPDTPPVDVLVRYVTGKNRLLKSNMAFFAKVWVLLRYLLGVLSSKEHVKNRQMFYTALPGIKRHELTKLLDDMAVTLEVHPYNLLLEYEETGRFRVGGGIRLKLCLITNVARAADTKKRAKESGQYPADAVENDVNCCLHRTYLANDSRADDYAVPARIWSIELRTLESVKVVVVCEHRNVGKSMWQEENMDGVILVMTGGYPSIGTREFLAYLAKYLLKSVPFLWISDMDPNGVHMYSILKFGCRRTAWAAASTMVCPRLQLIGDKTMVIHQLETHTRTEWENDRTANKPSERQLEAKLKSRKIHIEKRMSKTIQSNIRPVVTGMRKRGYFDHDEVLRRAVEEMENTGCWSISVFAAVQTEGLEIFLVNTACRYANQQVTTKPRYTELVSQNQKNMNMHPEPATSSSNPNTGSAVMGHSEDSQESKERFFQLAGRAPR